MIGKAMVNAALHVVSTLLLKASEPVDTGAMRVRRRVSSTFKDIPGGQILGPTFDYTHRLLDPALAEGFAPEPPATAEATTAATPRVTDILGRDGLIEASPQAEPGAAVGDLTREPLDFPADRDLRLQYLAGLGLNVRQSAVIYSSMVGYRRFPDDLFVGTDVQKSMLQSAIDGQAQY